MKKIAILFPGQGSQFIGMGKSLYTNFEKAKEIFEEANDTLGFDLKKLCFEGDIKELTQTHNAQPAILTVSYSAFKIYTEEYELKPSYLVGHSLGEFTALTSAGAIDFSDALKIVRKRGELMNETSSGAMSAIKNISSTELEEVCKKITNKEHIVLPANYNSEFQNVISGHKEAVEKACARLLELGAEIIPLNVSGAFHSPLMQVVFEKFEQELAKYKFNDFTIPVVSTFDAKVYKDKDEIKYKLAKQITNCVLWKDAMTFLSKKEVEIAIDAGPGKVARNLFGQNTDNVPAFSLDIEDDRKKLVKYIGSKNLHFIKRSLGIAICEKNNNHNNDEEYEQNVIKPYREMRKIYETIMDNNKFPKIEYVEQAMCMLENIFKTKKVPQEIQMYRYKQILNETGLWNIFPKYKPGEMK